MSDPAVHNHVHVELDVTPPRYVEADLSVPLSQDAIGATMFACDIATVICVGSRWLVATLERFNQMLLDDSE